MKATKETGFQAALRRSIEDKKKLIQKDRPLPLKRAITDAVFSRKDSKFLQVRFAGPDGKLIRRTAATRSESAARQFLVLAKRQSGQVSQLPPPNPPAVTPEFPNFSTSDL